MNLRSMLVPAALAAALAVPAFAHAQTVPAQAQPAAAQGQKRHHGGGWMREIRTLNLTAAQQAQIKSIMQAFRQAHPPGSARDPQARKELREKILAVLTPAQQQKLKDDMAKRRARSGDRDRDRDDRKPAPSPSPSI